MDRNNNPFSFADTNGEHIRRGQSSKGIVRFNDVSKVYKNGTQAINNLTFNIEKGEFVFLMGASGAGKSTLIKMLMLEERPTSGKIIVAGRDLSKIGRLRIPSYRQKLGVVFQDFRLIENKSVFENVALALEIVGESRKRIKDKVGIALELVGIADKADRMPDELSGGEQQRTAVARAIVNAPEILIADEPTGNLDPENSEKLLNLLEEINRMNTTVLIATHEQELALRMNKRIIMLEHGGFAEQ